MLNHKPTTAELVAEMLSNCAAICQVAGFTIEDFVELAAVAFAGNEGDEIDEIHFECTVSERPPSN